MMNDFSDDDNRCHHSDTSSSPVKSEDCEVAGPRHYLVISYDSDEQQAFYDSVLATSQERAIMDVARVREYATPVDCWLVDDFLNMAQRLSELGANDVANEMRDLQAAHDLEKQA